MNLNNTQGNQCPYQETERYQLPKKAPFVLPIHCVPLQNSEDSFSLFFELYINRITQLCSFVTGFFCSALYL